MMAFPVLNQQFYRIIQKKCKFSLAKSQLTNHIPKYSHSSSASSSNPDDQSFRATVDDPTQVTSRDEILPEYVNRNPRNLEMLRIARKPQGYDLESKPPGYWYRLEMYQKNRHTIGLVRQDSGKVVLTTSTKEWALQSRLPSCMDHTSVVTVGNVLARRCLEAGFTEMTTDLFPAAEKSKNISAFLDAMIRGGVRLEEPFQLHEADMYPFARVHPTLPWQVPEDVAVKMYPQSETPAHNVDKTKKNRKSKVE